MKRISILATLILVAVALLSVGCGSGDKIGSVAMQVVGSGTGTVNLAGLGGTLQLQVLAVYTSGKQIDETNFATYTIMPQGFYWTYDPAGNEATQISMPPTNTTPPQGISLDKTGMVTAISGICSWVNVGPSATAPAWAFTGDYMITATYRGFTSNPVFIPLASAASGANNTNGACGPSGSGQ